MNLPFQRSKSISYRLIIFVVVVATAFGAQAPSSVIAQSIGAPLAAVSTINLNVVSAADGTTPVGNFKYIINVDNTGTTEQRSPAPGTGCSPQDPGYPDSCHWVSIASTASSAPIYTQGNQVDFPGGVFTINNAPVQMPAGRYLISILADGYKIDGAHFTVPGSGNVKVEMQPYDLPDATIQAEVFVDNAPTNSAPDVPAERGIAGFTAHISDYIDEVTTDVYGDPLCGNGHCLSKCYVVDGGVDTGIVNPRNDGTCPLRDELPANATTADTHVAISATAVIEGKVIIPNLGPNRYALSVVPPDKSGWAQTTTLEGNHDWDAWVMEGATGLDTEFVVAGEPFPATFFGYVKPTNTMGAGSGTIRGNALAVSAYIPPVGGIGGETGLMGAKPKDKNPIKSLYVSLSDLNNNDQTVFMKHYDCSGVETGGCPFEITGVPDGDYVLGIWDEPQDYIFGEQNVSIVGGELTDVGSISMLGWWTTIEGHVFNDLNENGKMDAGEPGIPNFPIVMRTRENSIMDRGTTGVTTDANGYYWMESAYPITRWLVEEAYADGFQTTGITYQADNQSQETTILGQGVDVNVHPVIGLGGRLDWGVKAYTPGTNGGIVGTISYDTTRNELDPSYSAIENWQPSISGLTVDLYAPLDCQYDPNTGEPTGPCDPTGAYQLEPDGSYKLGNLINQYISETWDRPTGCIARDVNGDPLQYPDAQQVLPLDPNAPCLEAPMMGVQFGPMADGVGSDQNFGATVDGNYGFGDGCFNIDGTPGEFNPATGTCSSGDFSDLPSNRDYLVKVEIPNDDFGRPLYQVTREEDINIANGDSFVPQVPPPACAGPLHTVDVAQVDGGSAPDNYPAVIGAGYDMNGVPIGVTVPASTPVDNPNFVGIGGTPYEGMQKNLCDMKLVHVSDRKSIAPGFNLYTDVPLPGRFWGLTVDDLNFSSDPKSQAYGEKLPLAFNPVGIYDYTNRLIYTVESDYNGLWDVLLPSTNRISCPTPSGVCANLYRFVGNDPGVPGHWNPNYDPQYRTIAAEFEAFPGLTLPADLAPTPVSVAVQIPGTQTIKSVACTLNDPTGAVPATTPEFFAISKPYMRISDSGAARTFTIQGNGFGSQGTVMLDNFTMAINSWNNASISFAVPSSGPNSPSTGPHQLKITAAGKTTVNALTFHVLNNANSNPNGNGIYNPTILEVGVGRTYDPRSPIRNTGGYEHALQDALNAAANVQSGKALVVVYPGPVDASNPRYNGRGAYYENIVIHSAVKLQGIGPGGVYPNGTPVQGSILDGIGFGGDTALADGWRTLVGGLTWPGNQDVSDGEVIYILPASQNQFGSNYRASIDGLDIRGGDQMGFPGNLNAIFGGYPGPAGAVNAETQGGAIFANSFANYLQITNNLVENNSGTYGTIRIGTPNIDASQNNNQNVRIANNRIIANGGTNLAGAIGLFAGSNNYEVANNDICGNFSAEYGGGISHFGRSNNGSIHDNRIYFNHSYDEGAGIMIAGELATVPTARYGQPGGPQGSGPVNIYNNLIQGNMSEDDGGGLRFLMAGNFPMNVYNNMLVNNIATHEGGGVALDDAPNVRFYNNTVMNNKTTATAITSNGQPAPAGLSTGSNSAQLQPTLPSGSPAYSNPLLFNDIFYNNWAGTKGINTVTGITPGNNDPWDMGVVGVAGNPLTPTNSVLQPSSHPGAASSGTNRTTDPAVNNTLDIPLSFTSWRTNINFIGAIMVTADLPPQLLSDYHLSGTGSPANNLGAASASVPTYQRPAAPTPYQASGTTSLNSPPYDIDNQTRPALGGYESGADEFPGVIADLSITKTDGQTLAPAGGTIRYTITISNGGPNNVALASVTDNVPAVLTGVTWTCSVPASPGYACGAASGSGSINTTVNLPAGGSATFTLNASIPANATGTLANAASVAVPAGTTDPAPGNNSATDTDTIARLADLSITKTDGVTSVTIGASVNYTIVISNAGPLAVTSAPVTDTFPAALTVNTWTCATSSGSSCTVAGSGNNRTGTVSLLNGGSATFTATTTLNGANTGSLANTATVNIPAGLTDPNTANNTATDTDAITLAKPALGLLDNFNRSNAATLGANWSQPTSAGTVIRLNSNQANCALLGNCLSGSAIWNGATNVFNNKQGVAVTFTSAPISGTSLILKASGGTASAPANFIRVRNAGLLNQIVVETTTNSGGSFTTRGTLSAALSSTDTLTAVANADGSVDVWVTTSANVTTYLGRSSAVAAPFIGTGRIGMQLILSDFADNFSGGNVP
jgi:uncharacterized repeat protein (TIGR01451 family)